MKRRAEYTAWEAAQLLRLGVGEVLALIDNHTLHAEVKLKRKQLGGRRQTLLAWSEIASVAMIRWSVMQIHDALGKDADLVLPRLLRPTELKKVRLPEYQLRLLETLAQNDGVTLEEYIYEALLALEVMGDPDTIERLLPGFKDAMRFPDV